MGTRKKVELFTCVRYFLRKLVDCGVLKDCVFKSNSSTQRTKQQKHVRRDGQNWISNFIARHQSFNSVCGEHRLYIKETDIKTGKLRYMTLTGLFVENFEIS